jgi:hypothetical protein
VFDAVNFEDFRPDLDRRRDSPADSIEDDGTNGDTPNENGSDRSGADNSADHSAPE